MKNQNEVLKSAGGRYNQIRRHAKALLDITQDRQYTELTKEELQEMRDCAQGINQCLHEFNAYKNVLDT